ncbi:MAG: glycine cleavage system protein GcvH [Erysipelotrichaceae bacterium]|nr:glycine cleavage system protein GcvH [Erysipelotrichaceae bacterium]
MEVREELKYTATHEWVRDLGNGLWEVGITDFAQSELGDIVFINLPEVGDEVVKEEAFGDLESVKAVSDIYSPFSGTVREINEEVVERTEAINNAPYEAWLIRVENVTDCVELLDAQQYQEVCDHE